MPVLAQSVSGLAASSGVRACLDWLRRERAWINEQHLKLCRVPAPTFFEQKRAEWMAEQFKAVGWDAKLDRVGNVIATLPGKRDLPTVAVTAHLDTVFAPRVPEDVRFLKDGRMVGAGVSDNGAGLAALLALAAAWKAAPPLEGLQCEPMFVANVGEEGEGNLSGMRYLCRPGAGHKIKAFLVLDGPNTDHITCQALGSRRFEVTLAGPGGHSWRDYGVGNPVHALGRAITLFTDEARTLGLETSPRTTFNFGLIEGGSSINAIPGEARTKIDLRSESAERIDRLAGLLTTAVETAVSVENARSQGGRLTARLKEIGSRPSGSLPDDSPILEYIRAVDSHLGIRSRLDCSSTDANIPLALGLPAISIGAGGLGGGAHTPDEWFQPDGRELGLRRVLLVLCLLLLPD